MKILDLTNVFIFWIGSLLSYWNSDKYNSIWTKFLHTVFIVIFPCECLFHWFFPFPIFLSFPCCVYVCVYVFIGKECGTETFLFLKLVTIFIYYLFSDVTKEKERILLYYFVIYTNVLLHIWMRYEEWVLTAHFNTTYHFTVFDLIS